jgi:hypothetical protein
MMDPLSALGVASNIIQLITFTNDLVSKGREIYKAVDGELVENLELETIAKSLQDLSSCVSTSLKSTKKRTFSETDYRLKELCDGCNEVSRQLIAVISELKAEGRHKKWNSFRQALNSVWKKEAIDALLKRLERYRGQLDTTLLVSLRQQIQNDGDLVHSVYEKPSPGQAEVKPWHAELIEVLRKSNWKSTDQQDTTAFSLRLSAYTKDEREYIVKAQILEQLHFTNMGDRYERIDDAYRKTFNWIFQEGEKLAHDPEMGARMTGATTSPSVRNEDSWILGHEDILAGDVRDKANNLGWSNFIDGLANSEERMYWITGKPGSGKSTLMKYLYNDPRTRKHLSRWSGSSTLVTAGFFFWNSGTVMQMSKLGLLQALLYKCLQNSLELIPVLFPGRWKSYELLGGDLRPWTWSELASAFQSLLSDKSRYFIFFIDGLDEFDGNCTELSTFVLEHSAKRNVKICVASRPWLVFEDAFQQRPSLRLEDLTAPDMVLFVGEKLRANNMFIGLEVLQPLEAKHLIIEVTEKASGVFLWVRLVVSSLLEGLRDGDTITDLEERMHQLPSDLEDLFSKILNRLDILYFKQASKLFQLVHQADSVDDSLTLLDLSFAEDGLEKAIAAEVEEVSLMQSKYRAETMRRRLNSRCKGLLEAPALRHQTLTAAEAKVQYLHRTVKDFLRRPEVWNYIISGTTQSFEPDICLLGVSLMNVKCLPMSEKVLPAFEKGIARCTKYSAKAENRKSDHHIELLQELNRTAIRLFGKSCPDGTWMMSLATPPADPQTVYPPEYWTILLSKRGSKSLKMSSDYELPYLLWSFFEYAFQYSFYSFVDHELRHGHKADSLIGDHSLLYAAVEAIDTTMIETLLNHKADPNFRGKGIKTRTAWVGILYRIQEQRIRQFEKVDTELEASIVESFLEHNADPRVIVCNRSVEEIIKLGFQNWDAERTSHLLHKVAVSRRAYRNSQKASSKLMSLSKKFGRKNLKADVKL